MAYEEERGCGFRRVGGMYLCGEFIAVSCDRLPLPLTTCPVCGQGIKVSRGFTQINPFTLWGVHDGKQLDPHTRGVCKDLHRPCHVCDPLNQLGFIMLVGEKYYPTPQAFMDEAQRMGVSKRIPFIPRDMELGKTVVYLAHPKACELTVAPALQQALSIVEGSETKQPRLLEAERTEKQLGIFCAFVPQRVEKLIWESEATAEEMERLEKRGITPVRIPDGDEDHL